ncbi:short-chain fatty acids transporter [Virgibacillus natechei]|uniref:Short-chain fatty acids transporter n=1 Tax=Virgibacillus natechei TaxID=1216297 RepID=A0ABS4ILC9_9BACI|nr:short-chain fatty acid transporter [Virgibacillus natechei]MBP1971216.1 short-chain fatty acids transporter [Virgibacillus natechei]UZD11964.1 short-chain fatty acid transporter [Virgibacillus natechei]
MKTLTSFFDRMVQRYLPDAFLFAIILTFLVFLLGVFFTDSGPVQMIEHWGGGFWDLLDFAMQMALVVVTGYILASAPIIRNGLAKLSNLAKTPAQAIMLVTFVALIACLINYGFGLVVGALFAVHVAKRVPTVDYRLLIASAYSGMLVWHGGFSASIPLLIATPGHFLEDTIGTIPVVETLFSPINIFIVLFLVVTLPFFNRYLMKGTDPLGNTDTSLWKTDEEDAQVTQESTEALTPADRLENSQTVSFIVGIMGLAYIFYHFVSNGFNLNINIVNFIFLFLGIIFHRTPKRFLDTVMKGVRNVGGIIVQFPFYAGIMGMMVASGLSQQMSEWFISLSTEFTFPLFTFISAGIVNFFVPSGGGQWAVQGPIMIPASIEIGVDTAKTVMAVAWGDAWTNMIQPFWALPVLAIAGLKVRDIMGFCLMILLYSFIPIAIGLLFF